MRLARFNTFRSISARIHRQWHMDVNGCHNCRVLCAKEGTSAAAVSRGGRVLIIIDSNQKCALRLLTPNWASLKLKSHKTDNFCCCCCSSSFLLVFLFICLLKFFSFFFGEISMSLGEIFARSWLNVLNTKVFATHMMFFPLLMPSLSLGFVWLQAAPCECQRSLN